MKIILASKSPRRKILLKKIGLNFETIPSNAKEIEADFGDIDKIVTKNAEIKSEKIAKNIKKVKENAIIIGADTLVTINNKILGKPKTKNDAKNMITMLSGTTHTAVTGICVINTKTNEKIIEISKTQLVLRKLDEQEIDDYISTDLPYGKAGSYNITDDFTLIALESINGSYTNTMGLPLEKLIPILKKFKININTR
ncbi:septum formation protein Maf [archaeon]|nr:septum formation protein Maf [archaeon]